MSGALLMPQEIKNPRNRFRSPLREMFIAVQSFESPHVTADLFADDPASRNDQKRHAEVLG